MSLGSHAPQKADINMTPMIDVLLVLIIIFMVIAPLSPRGLHALVPQPSPAGPREAGPAHAIVITVRGGGEFALNQEVLDRRGLEGRLLALFKNSANDVVFVRGGKDLEFRQVAEVLDIARGAGVSRVALMTN